MAFDKLVTPTCVTDEVVQATMKLKNINERAALFMLGFRLDQNLHTYTHRVRHPKRPYELYEAKVHKGLLRNTVAYEFDMSGKVVPKLDDKGRLTYTNKPHHLQGTYEEYSVVGMKEFGGCEKSLTNILDFGNEYREV